MTGRSLITKEEHKTISPTGRTCIVQTANRIVEVQSEAKVHIKKLDVHIYAKAAPTRGIQESTRSHEKMEW